MINPELTDWWSKNHLTDIWYEGISINGAGVSMQVVNKVFTGNEYIWFSRIYGKYDDNLLLLGFKPHNQVNQIIRRPIKKGQKRFLFGPPLFNEFQITDEIASRIGLITSNDGFEIANKDELDLYIYSHDNFVFYIEPIDNELLRKVVNVILRQHSFYLERNIDWSPIQEELIELLKSKKHIELQSDPIRHIVWLPQIEENKHIFWKLFRPGTIVIRNNQAVFRKRK